MRASQKQRRRQKAQVSAALSWVAEEHASAIHEAWMDQVINGGPFSPFNPRRHDGLLIVDEASGVTREMFIQATAERIVQAVR